MQICFWSSLYILSLLLGMIKDHLDLLQAVGRFYPWMIHKPFRLFPWDRCLAGKLRYILIFLFRYHQNRLFWTDVDRNVLELCLSTLWKSVSRKFIYLQRRLSLLHIRFVLHAPGMTCEAMTSFRLFENYNLDIIMYSSCKYICTYMCKYSK